MKKAFVIFLSVLAGLLLCSCVYDGPPKDDGTSSPAPHEGLFVSEHGSIFFRGDGSAVIDLDAELAEITGLPVGDHRATVRFLANTPPHRYETRWDRANELEISSGGAVYIFGMGNTDEKTIRIYAFPEEGGTLDLVFVKE